MAHDLGCFKDADFGSNKRCMKWVSKNGKFATDLPIGGSLGNHYVSSMTRQLCNTRCKALGYRYAGTQLGGFCFCARASTFRLGRPACRQTYLGACACVRSRTIGSTNCGGMS